MFERLLIDIKSTNFNGRLDYARTANDILQGTISLHHYGDILNIGPWELDPAYTKEEVIADWDTTYVPTNTLLEDGIITTADIIANQLAIYDRSFYYKYYKELHEYCPTIGIYYEDIVANLDEIRRDGIICEADIIHALIFYGDVQTIEENIGMANFVVHLDDTSVIDRFPNAAWDWYELIVPFEYMLKHADRDWDWKRCFYLEDFTRDDFLRVCREEPQVVLNQEKFRAEFAIALYEVYGVKRKISACVFYKDEYEKIIKYRLEFPDTFSSIYLEDGSVDRDSLLTCSKSVVVAIHDWKYRYHFAKFNYPRDIKIITTK